MVILTAALLVGVPGISAGGLNWSDAPQHVFDGVFLYELAKAWPVEDLRAWSEQFYLRYPALGMVVYWPPGFAIVEAAAFGLFGVSIAVARGVVLFFAVGAGLLIYRLGRRWFDRWTGLFAAIILLSCPHGARWARDVMLEWPATFWILAVVAFYQALLDTGRRRWAVALAAATILAFLTKQSTGFIVPVIAAHLLIRHRRAHGAPPRSSMTGGSQRRPTAARAPTACLISLASASLFIALYLVATHPFTAILRQLLQPAPSVSNPGRWAIEILGWPLLPIAVLGVLSLVARPDRGPRGLLLIWLVGWTGFCLLITAQEPRYLFFSLVPAAFASVRYLVPGPREPDANRPFAWRTDAARIGLLFVLAAVQMVLVHKNDPGPLPRYDGAVAALAARPDADLVLIDAVRDGQFVFDVYHNAAARDRIIPLRASKLLYARAARERYGYRQFVDSPSEIVALLDRYGIRYIVVESRLPATPYTEADPPPRKMLRRLLATDDRFDRVAAWPLDCGDPIWKGVELRLYEYRDCPPRTAQSIRLSFPGMGREVEFTIPGRRAQAHP